MYFRKNPRKDSVRPLAFLAIPDISSGNSGKEPNHEAICSFAGDYASPTSRLRRNSPTTAYGGYLDVLTCKVKPEKRTDFDAVAKKMADANRRYKGDSFLASQVEYGEQNTVIFTSGRSFLPSQSLTRSPCGL